jgi:CRISPR-associated protein (TIGR02584 family)
LFVAGVTPQIITETVYALCDRERRPPRTEVVVLTTTVGKQRIERELLGQGRAWSSLRKTYPKARRFSLLKRNVLLLVGPDGQPLEDVRTTADSEAAAEFILKVVRRFTGDGEPPLHASLAGGRKTMGYLLGAAMILCGRPNDRLSHVLVEPSELEASSFFFPLPGVREIPVAGSKGLQRIAASRVRIDLLCNGPEFAGASFRRLVELLQTRLTAFLEPRVEVRLRTRQLRCAGERIALSPEQFGIYYLLVHRRMAHGPDANCPGCENCFVPEHEVAGRFAEELRAIAKKLQSFAVRPGRWGTKNFLPEVSHINRALEEALGNAAEPYKVQRSGRRKSRLYGLALPPSVLSFREE